MTQQLRPSQFMYNYGPGAILEGKNGPRIILNPNRGLFFTDSPYLQRIHKYDIVDERMSKGLLQEGKIFRLPTNAEEKIPSNEIIYHTNPFPIWKLCLNFQMHQPQEQYILYLGNSCPVCNFTRGVKQEAIRFVTACPNGHLDEIDWDYLTHRNNDRSKSQCTGTNNVDDENNYFIYYRGNGSISSIMIECPRCERPPVSFARAYSGTLPCTSRQPENEEMNQKPQRRYRSCNRRMKIIQRQASSLRVVEVKTLLQIKSGITRLQVMLREDKIKSSFKTLKRKDLLPVDKESFEKELGEFEEDGLISKSRKEEILHFDWPEIEDAMNKATEQVPKLTYSELVLEEFKELMKGTGDEGIPPVSSPRPKSEILFEMDPSLRKWFSGPAGKKFLVAPVSKLATITVQTGYRREIKDDTMGRNNQILPPSVVEYRTRLPHADGKIYSWYPGVVSIGEGLFIRLDENDGWQFPIEGQSQEKWLDMFNNSTIYDRSLFRGEQNVMPEELHPVFVWWHTISHAIIRTIGEEAGYSSSAIKERVFLEIDENRVRGGILLYATQSGSEGSLGGLISLAPYLDDMIQNAFNQIEICSGDPLCIDENFEKNKYNGASCYGCTMNSETSCEHRNMWLDRHIVLDNIP